MDATIGVGVNSNIRISHWFESILRTMGGSKRVTSINGKIKIHSF
jgi:hypothetical protein